MTSGEKSRLLQSTREPHELPFYHNGVWTRLIQCFYLVITVLACVLCFIAFSSINDVQEIARGPIQITRQSASQAAGRRLQSNAATQSGVAFVVQIASVLAGLSFLGWTHRAYSNLPALGVWRPTFYPLVAVLLCLIPVVNLFAAFLVMQEIWTGSDPDRAPGMHKSGDDNPSVAVAIWWLLGILNLGLGIWFFTTALQGKTPADLVFVLQIQIVVGAMVAVHLAYSIWLLGAILQNQDIRRTLILDAASRAAFNATLSRMNSATDGVQ